MIEANNEQAIRFELLSDPRPKQNKKKEVFGYGLFAVNKTDNDRFAIQIEILSDDGELFEECRKRVETKSETKRLRKGSVVKVKGSFKESSWRIKGSDDEWGHRYSFRPSEIAYS